MEHVNETLRKKYNNVINVNKKNDNNDNKGGKNKYELDKAKFTPNTEEAMLSEEIGSYFNDLQNFAFYYSVINKLGVTRGREALADIKDEIQQKAGTKYAIRNPKKYFAWKYKRGLY